MTLPAIVNTARTLSYYNTLQDVMANNLANVSSDGYKSDRVTAHSLEGNPHPQAVQTIDLSQGELRETGRPLDVSLQGPGFTVIKTANGERLTRGGAYQVSADGMLVDRNGNQVLGVDGPLHVAGNKIEIKPDGTIVVDRTEVGRLRLATVADTKTLLKEGNGDFVASTPLQDATNIGVHQGALESSNMSALTGSVDLIMIQRAYASSVDALRVMDGVMGVVANEIGRV